MLQCPDSLITDCQIFFQRECSIFNTHQQYRGIPVVPYPHQLWEWPEYNAAMLYYCLLFLVVYDVRHPVLFLLATLTYLKKLHVLVFFLLIFKSL